MDPFLLAAFCKANPKTTVCDLGAGNGILSFLIYKMYCCMNIYSLEIQKDAFSLLAESVTANHLEQVIIPLLGDLRQLPSELPKRSFDLVVCNPPLFQTEPFSQ